jgi:hypothetical protein
VYGSGAAWSLSIMEAAEKRAQADTAEALAHRHGAETFVVKLQAPRDDSDDSRGGALIAGPNPKPPCQYTLYKWLS